MGWQQASSAPVPCCPRMGRGFSKRDLGHMSRIFLKASTFVGTKRLLGVPKSVPWHRSSQLMEGLNKTLNKTLKKTQGDDRGSRLSRNGSRISSAWGCCGRVRCPAQGQGFNAVIWRRGVLG